jgi:hypothetical protein
MSVVCFPGLPGPCEVAETHQPRHHSMSRLFIITFSQLRNGILGHQSNNKRLESFAPCHSQSLLGGFQRRSYSSLVLKNLTKIPVKQKNWNIHEWHFL